MKILFNNIALFKKEAKLLARVTKDHEGTLFTLQQVRDSLAKAYGWTHFNEMSKHHASFNKLRSDLAEFLSFTKAKLGVDYQYVQNLNDLEYNTVLARKQKFFTELLVENGLDSSTALSILKFVESKFNKRKEVAISYKNFSDLSNDDLRKHTFINSSDTSFTEQMLKGVPVKKALDNGGFFILRAEIFDNIYHKIMSEIDDKNRISVVNLAKTPFESPRLVKATSEVNGYFEYHGFRMLMSYGFQAFVSKDSQDLFSRHSQQFAQSIIAHGQKVLPNSFNVLAEVFDPNTSIKRKKEILSMSNKNGLIVNENVQELNNYLETYNEEQLQYMFNQMHFVYSELEDAQDNDAVKIPFMELLKEKNITLIRIDKNERSHLAAGLLTMYRSKLAPQLGRKIKMTSQEHNDLDRENGIKATQIKPIVLDCYQHYPVKGMSIVFAHLRSLGYASFYVIDNTYLFRKNDEIEFLSLYANTVNQIFEGDTAHKNISDLMDYSHIDLNTIIEATKSGCYILIQRHYEKNTIVHPILK